MNLNAIRTILGALATVLISVMAFAPQILGCAAGVDGKFDCATSWLPPSYAATAAAVLGVMALVLKTVQGLTGGGSVTGALFSKTVVVSKDGQPGTVTQASVDTPGR